MSSLNPDYLFVFILAAFVGFQLIKTGGDRHLTARGGRLSRFKKMFEGMF